MVDGSEGTIEVEDGYRVWYRRVGDGGATPLLVLHGGPGAGHDYLDTLDGLADERPVIFYDQLGCGRSDQPDDPSRWHIARFVREVDLVRQALGLSRVHLLGQSWGGWLAIEYMLGAPAGIAGLVLASTSASIPQFVAECERLKSELPPDVYATLQKYEAAQDYRNPAYEKAADGVLQATPLQAVAVARPVPAHRPEPHRQPGVRDDERPQRVHGDRQPADVGPHRPARRDPRTAR